MASLSLKHIYKVYDGNVKAVNDFNMEIEDKEFIVFVGPSGCGKSTTLRMIAGLEEITAGELMIGDEVVNDVEPKDRNIAMVFQNYALYPHMTVRENMEFALKLKKLPQDEIDRQVNEAARILDISQYLDRKPRALSGGQRQRVSLGRAIVRNPKVFLLDEPLSNLDAKLRAQMRTEISKLHDRLATTFIYVTHDQVEAMTMGTRIVVMRSGFVQQIDTPQNLYNYPCNMFVAGFIGTPQMNFFEATLLRKGDKVVITFANDRVITVPYKYFRKAKDMYFDGERKVVMGIRPEDVHLDEAFVNANPDTVLKTDISIVEALGSESIVYCELDPEHNTDITETKTRLVIKVDPRTKVCKGDEITVAIDPERIHLFEPITENTILPRIPETNEVEGVVSNGVLSIYGTKINLPANTLEDGKYLLSIPTDAILFEGLPTNPRENIEAEFPVFEKPTNYDPKYAKKHLSVVTPVIFNSIPAVPTGELLHAKIQKEEIVNKQVLLELAIGDSIVYALAPSKIDAPSVNISIDLKRVSFIDENRNLVATDLGDNYLLAHFVSEKANKNEYNYILNIEGTNFYATKEISDKLITALGRKVFDVLLKVDFSPYGAVFAEEGLECEVIDIIDYGTEKFAVCSGEKCAVTVYIPKDKEITLNSKVKVQINPYTLGIVDLVRDIRII